MKLEESHLDDYLADNEYAVTYIDGEGKEKQIKFKPSKNTNIAGIQKQLGEAYKDFFKLKDIKEFKEEGKETMNKTDAINKVMKHIETTLNKGKDDLTIKSQDNGDINVYDKTTEKELLVITPQELRRILTESKLVDPAVKEDTDAIMQGKALSVKDKEIISFIEDKLEAELGKDWKKKSLIDIEDITYDAVYEWGNNHNEEDIHPQPYYVELKRLIGRLEGVNESMEPRQITVAEKILLNAIKAVSDYELDEVVCETSPNGNVHVTTKDGKDICTINRSEFAINGDDTELIDELRFNGYWKEPDFEDKDTLEEEVLIEKDGKYDTMAFAQWLPMSFTDYVDSHIKDDYEEMGSNYNKVENFIEDYVLQYQEDYLDAEEQEEFEYDLAKDYVRYKLDNIEKKEEKVLTSSNGKFKKGDIYVNGNGALIRITDYTKSGTPQYDIGMPTDFAMGTYTCKGMASDEELQALLDNNGYRKISESREIKTEATALSANDDNNTVIVNKNQYGYSTIAIIIDDTNKRYQLVSGQSLPTGKYKKASKKAIRDKADKLKAQGYEEVKGPNSLAESKEIKTEEISNKFKCLDIADEIKSLLDDSPEAEKIVTTNNGFYDLEQKGLNGYGVWLGYSHGRYSSEKKMNSYIRQIIPQVKQAMIKELSNKGVDCDESDIVVEDMIDTTDMIRLYYVENNKLTESSMSKEDIMACYINDITQYAYTYTREAAQKEIDFILDDLRNDKDLDDKDKAMVMRFVRGTLLDRDIKFEESKKITESKEAFTREDLKNLLDNGHIIIVSKSKYTPTEYLIENDKVYYNNKEISFGWNEHPNMKSEKELLDFLEKMQNEGFVLEHKDRTEKDKITEGKDLSKEDEELLDKYTDEEIRKMYNRYFWENEGKGVKSFEEWQKENVDSALINELEYEFFSNRKTEGKSASNELNNLASKIYDWYDADMGNHFDEVKGNEEEVYNDILVSLENKDQNNIDKFISDMEEDESMGNVVSKLKSLKEGKKLQEDVMNYDLIPEYVENFDSEDREHLDRAIEIYDEAYFEYCKIKPAVRDGLEHCYNGSYIRTILQKPYDLLSGISETLRENLQETLEEETLIERVEEDGDNVTITEYVITFNDWKWEDRYFSTKEEADAEFESLKRDGNIDKVSQYYRKDWEWNGALNEYEEGYVEVYYNEGDELEEGMFDVPEDVKQDSIEKGLYSE